LGALCGPGGAEGVPRPGPFLAGRPPRRALEAEREYRTKADFLLNFIRYTTWPRESFRGEKAPFELLIVGSDPFGGRLLKTFEGKELHGRKVIVSSSRSVPKKIRAHLVFATDLKEGEMSKLMALCKRRGVLLIGDQKGLAERGGCADFFVKQGQVRFRVNPAEAKSRGLGISSQLLKLATLVKTKRSPPGHGLPGGQGT